MYDREVVFPLVTLGILRGEFILPRTPRNHQERRLRRCSTARASGSGCATEAVVNEDDAAVQNAFGIPVED